MLFYKNVCGNVTENYTRSNLEGQMRTELLTALGPAFAKISAMGIRYSALPGHTFEIAEALNEVLTPKWRNLRGIEIVSFGVSNVNASEEDEAMIKELQKTAVFRNANMAGAYMVGAQGEAMKAAASNPNGAMMGFMGMGMAQQAGGMNAAQLFQIGQQQTAQQQAQQLVDAQAKAMANAAATDNSWKCSCGATATGKFCPECGSKKPEPKSANGWKCACGAMATGKFCPECGSPKPADNGSWTCSCGAKNTGKFCAECGSKKPAGVPQYRCDKCGWQPADPTKAPRFCPECGDPFDNGDIV
jgi:membrane protease subunit (stomatin/prohibitin family)